MPRRMENTFCCGGGGGQMWLETDPNTRLNLRRLDEAVANDDVEMIVTACPYCTIMFDDAIRDKGLSESIVVRDIAEVLSGNGRKSSS
jgi:Fe-S oxidoreductase